MKSSIPIIDHDIYTIRKLLLIIGLISFVLGSVSVAIRWRGSGSLLLLISTIIFFRYNILNKTYKVYRKIYLEYIPDDKVNDMLNHGSFEFTHEYLNYKIKKVSQKIHWSDISYYKLINSKHILLFHKEADKNVIISETEMDSADFKTAIEFIKERVKKITFNMPYRKF